MADSIATTTYGPIQGSIEDGVHVFKGVPYGADTATTRFAAPHPPSPWTEVRDAAAYGPSSPQAPAADVKLFRSWRHDPPLPTSEDCLSLNVWTPGLRDGGRRPVMVWLHGGGFVGGSGSSLAYDGVRLCNRGDVVVVTVTHRLNVFGYLALGADFPDSGNAGTLDQVLALQWVRDNAAEFGGDPSNVTIFGESGGGGKVSVLMATEGAAGLFHRAVVQSGPWLRAIEPDVASATAARILDGRDARRFAALPVAEILEAAAKVGPSAGSGPVLDGRTLTRHPFDPDAAPQGAGVPMMIGTCRTESSLLIGAARRELFDLTWDTLPGALAPMLKDRDADAVVAGYRALHPARTAVDAYFTITSDRGFYAQSVKQADRKAQQGGAPVFFYMLDWDTPVDDGKWLCPHALDIAFMFDNVAKSKAMCGHGPDQARLADLMSEAWLAFARTGNPNHSLLPPWPAYEPATRSTMVFDVEPQVIDDPRARERELFRRS